MFKFVRNNSLSLVFLLLFLLTFLGQVHFGLQEYNKENLENGLAAVDLFSYLQSGHFFEATFENWESEFLQMSLFVWLSIFLYQKGSSESKRFDGTDEVDRAPDPNRKGAPAVLKRRGILARLYRHSLSISLFLLFALSFVLHLYGSLKDENEHKFARACPCNRWRAI